MNIVEIPVPNKKIIINEVYNLSKEVENWLNENIGNGFYEKYGIPKMFGPMDISDFEKSKAKWCYYIGIGNQFNFVAKFYIKGEKDKAVLFKLTWGGK